MLRTAAELLPEGCVLTLDLTQGLALTLPRHGALVDMQRDTGRPSLPAPLIEEVLRPGPASYSPSDALVRPRVPTLDLSAGCGRSDAVAPPLVPEGDVLLLQPAHTLVERSARAVDFASAAPRAPPVSLTLTPSPSLSLSRTPTLALALTLTRPRQRRYPRATC